MRVSDAFDRFDHEISPSWYHQAKAQDRLARFTAALTLLHSEIRVMASGSWARGTAIDPIHDVDLILVLPNDLRPRYDAGSRSAEAVLEYAAGLVVESAGLNNVHRVQPRNHVLKCYLDSKIATDDAEWHGFAVEVMPAFQDGGVLRVPEQRDDRWKTVDPEHLIKASERRQRAWPHYTAMVRMLKDWAREHPELHITPLAMEVLALRCLPHPPLLGRMSKTEALKRFFTAAAGDVLHGVHDPAGRSGEIAPGLDRWKARKIFLKMAHLAATADGWERSEHPDREDISVHFLREIFGRRFPRASRRWDHVDFETWLRPEPIARAERTRWIFNPGGDASRGGKSGPKPGPAPETGAEGGQGPGRGPGPGPGRGRGPGPAPWPGSGGMPGTTSPRPSGPRTESEPRAGNGPSAGIPTAGGTGDGGVAAGGSGVPRTAAPGSGASTGGSRFRNAAGHRATLGAVAGAAPITVRSEDPAG